MWITMLIDYTKKATTSNTIVRRYPTDSLADPETLSMGEDTPVVPLPVALGLPPEVGLMVELWPPFPPTTEEMGKISSQSRSYRFPTSKFVPVIFWYPSLIKDCPPTS